LTASQEGLFFATPDGRFLGRNNDVAHGAHLAWSMDAAIELMRADVGAATCYPAAGGLREAILG